MPNNIRQQAHWVSTGDPETVDDLVPYAAGMIGAIVTVKAPGPGATPSGDQGVPKSYQYVQGDSTMTVAPFKGALMWWADQIKYRVTTSPTTLGRGRVAGVYKKIGGPSNKGNYFFVQTEGLSVVKFIDAVTAAPTVAGLICIPSATAGKADCLLAGSAATYPAIGVSAGVYDAAQAEGVVNLEVPSAR